MSEKKNRTSCPLLSQEEREQLKRAAGDMPLSAFIRSFLPFDPTQRKIAKALNSGSLLITPDTEELIQEACKAIIQMHGMLMRALDNLDQRRTRTMMLEGNQRGGAYQMARHLLNTKDN